MRRPIAALLSSVLLSISALTGCSLADRVGPTPLPPPPSASPAAADTPSPSPAPATAQAAVGALFAAARKQDRTAWSAGLSRRDPAFAGRAEMLFANVGRLHLTVLAVQLTGAQQPLSASRRRLLGASAQVRQATVTWQLPGETGVAAQSVWLTLLPSGRGVVLAGTTDGLGPDAPAQPLWWLGAVGVVNQGSVTLLLGPGQPSSRWTALTVSSVAAARRVLPLPLARGWNGRVVVEVPATVAAFESVLGVSHGTYASTAAVTRPEGPTTDAATRIVVNPALATEPEIERRLTLSHETVHVATRSGASRAPLWAVEGLAEYVAYEAWPQARPDAERSLAGALRTSGIPGALPADVAFRAGANNVTVAYAEAWIACRTIADDHSRDELGALYFRLDDGASVTAAAHETFGADEGAIVDSWQRALARLLARSG